jgi:hypothetical protein
MPYILGMPLFAWGGVLLLILVTGQILGGMRIIRTPFRLHKINGFVILGVAVLHGLAGILFFAGII